MTEEQQWYVQNGSRVQGPFSTTEVGRYLLLGRIRPTDRVSKDGELWEPVTQVPELIPEELLDLESDTGWSRFLDVRTGSDERVAVNGDAGNTATLLRERRKTTERLSVESLRADWVDETVHHSRRRTVNILPVSLLCVSLAALSFVIYLNTMGASAS